LALCVSWVAAESQWLPAKVYSIQVGTSGVGDLTRAIGKPRQQTDNDNMVWRGGFAIYQYDVSWPVRGRLWAYADPPSKRLIFLLLKSLDYRMSDIVKTFGSEYQITRYRKQACEKGKKKVTFCADSNGPVAVYEYPEQGIVVFPRPNDALGDVYFVAKPLELLSCQCD